MRVAQFRTWWVMEAPTGQRFCVVKVGAGGFPGPVHIWGATLGGGIGGRAAGGARLPRLEIATATAADSSSIAALAAELGYPSDPAPISRRLEALLARPDHACGSPHPKPVRSSAGLTPSCRSGSRPKRSPRSADWWSGPAGAVEAWDAVSWRLPPTGAVGTDVRAEGALSDRADRPTASTPGSVSRAPRPRAAARAPRRRGREPWTSTLAAWSVRRVGARQRVLPPAPGGPGGPGRGRDRRPPRAPPRGECDARLGVLQAPRRCRLLRGELARPGSLPAHCAFTVQLFRPVVSGRVHADGRVVHQAGGCCRGVGPVDEAANELARGAGTFMRSAIPQDERVGYR